MTTERTYLDYNATAPMRPEARAAVVAALDVVGNPSSVHAEGRVARALIDDAREKVARLVGARPDEIVFTSGATEANNWVLSRSWRTVVFPDIEHTSVRAPCLASEGRLERIPVRTDGAADAALAGALIDGLAEAGAAAGGLFVLQAANNETGVIQPVEVLAHAARARGFKVFSDAVQAAGRIALDVDAMGIDYLSLSAHKLGGPKGVGALYARDRAGDGTGLPPLLLGGGQERRRRGGTENVAAIAGFGAAAEAALRDLADMERLARMRDGLEREVIRLTPGAVVIGADVPRLANTACVSLPGRNASELVIALDLAGIAVSAGSACSSGKVAASHVMAAMGLDAAVAKGAVRLSIGHATEERDIERLLAAWRAVAAARPATKRVTQQIESTSPAAVSSPRRRATASAGDR